MSSAAQVSANRANAQHSTGPVTAAGVANCKFNATKHGLTGKQVVIKGEDASLYDALRTALINELAPASETESMLVEEVAQNWWRLGRARRAEADMLNKLDLSAAMLDRAFMNLQRYMARIEREYNRARKDLAVLQSFRRKLEAEGHKRSARIAFAASLANQNGSVSHPDETVAFMCANQPQEALRALPK